MCIRDSLDRAAPWQAVKTDKAAAGRTIYTAIRAIDSLKLLLAPFLPFTSERLHAFLGYTQPLFGTQFVQPVQDALGEHNVLRYNPDGAAGRWQPSQIEAGRALQQPQPLFKKLDVSIVDEERGRLGEPHW
jgi:methionyl-tRNA synthetase